MSNKLLIKIRFFIQVLFFILFILMLINTRDPVENAHAYSIFQRLSIHLAIATSLASREFILYFVFSLIVIILTIIFGRFFCGFICPLGSTIDFTDRALIKKQFKLKFDKKYFKYIVLTISLALALFGVQLAGIIDPLSTVFRIYTIAIYPVSDFLTKSVFDLLYNVPIINSVSEPVYHFLSENILDYNNISFKNFFYVFLILFIIFIFAKLSPRFWCRYLCPLGAIYALTSKFSFLKRHVSKKKCVNCMKCENECRMKAIHDKGEKTFEGECIKCFDCLKSCKYNAIEFKFKLKNLKPAKESFENIDSTNIKFTRKQFLTSMASSALLFPIFKFNKSKNNFTRIIRPPGALKEEKFLEKCIKCGQCMKACPTNGLHPVLLETGIEGMFSPHLVPRRGYCEINCNLCSRVCPTKAIKTYNIKKKQKIKIGTAYIIKHLCFPWSENRNCIVCEEMCPVSTKAIKLQERNIVTPTGEKKKILLPYVVPDLCIGCGICENKCPVNGNAAIRVRVRKVTL